MELVQELFINPIDFIMKGGVFVAVIFLLTRLHAIDKGFMVKFHNVDKNLMEINDKLTTFISNTELRINKEVTEAKLTIKDNYISKDECKENRSYIYRELDRKEEELTLLEQRDKIK